MNNPYAMGPVGIAVREKLAEHLRSQKDANSLADDMMKLIAAGRDPEGFRAVNDELDRMGSSGAAETKVMPVKITRVPRKEPTSRQQNIAIAQYYAIMLVPTAIYMYLTDFWS